MGGSRWAAGPESLADLLLAPGADANQMVVNSRTNSAIGPHAARVPAQKHTT
ncbi:hypothetical protein [Streptomyces sp. MMBL 11-1]|uniref:hypothetical protein n=1 Tax=Streptomyces sp. MMBL 11-1 TaxID=3026420 RepID=UPI00236184F6|nr:hypothetical protein [Streptomyces sp. MMBL 11-1]